MRKLATKSALQQADTCWPLGGAVVVGGTWMLRLGGWVELDLGKGKFMHCRIPWEQVGILRVLCAEAGR